MVDVPGHERFVRTMVAGATGIDLYLMVVAADDGVMPQTREHAAVLAALGVTTGVVAVTKADLADPARARAEAAELLPGAEIVPVAAPAGRGSTSCAPRSTARPPACPGAPARAARCACTSTARSRSAAPARWSPARCGRAPPRAATRCRSCPRAPRARIRSVQVHDEPRRARRGRPAGGAEPGGVARDEVAAATCVVGRAPAPAPSFRVDVALAWATPDARPDGGTRVAVHHGTRESPARLAELGGRYFQLRLEQPLVPARGDRVVIRSLAPPDTLGGGVVLDPDPPRHGPSRDLLARLARLERGEPEPEPPSRRPAAAGARRARCRSHPPRSRSRSACARPATSRRPTELAADELAALRDHGRVVRLGRDMHIHREALADVDARVTALIERDGAITIAALRDELGPRAATPRRCSSCSTPSGSRCASATSACWRKKSG